MIVQAAEAVGKIAAPQATLSINPTTRTLVGLPTWLGLSGVGAGELTRTSAVGLVAIAAPDHMDVTPGDGGATLRCPWVTSATQAAASFHYAYPRSSVHGSASLQGLPAYPAQAQAVWKICLVDDGVPVVVPGFDTQLRGPVATTPVPLAETQALTR